MSKVFWKLGGKVSGGLALSCSLLLLFAPGVHAQLLNGEISGTVTDQQELAVSQVLVVVTDQGTNIRQESLTNDEGIYHFKALAPGLYTLEFQKSGFQTRNIIDIQVTASQQRVIPAVSLGVAAVTTTVTVSEIPGAELDRTSPTIQTTLSGDTVDNVPMTTSSLVPAGSRNFARYALISPVVNRVPGQNETSANGHTGRQNNFMADGSDNNDKSVTLPALFIPPEAIKEIHIQAAPYSAEFGRSLGAQVNVVTKSGSNDLRVELWDFARSSALEPLSLQSRKAGLTKTPHLVDHQFGASVGAPIVTDKTFIFGMFQGNLERRARTVSAASIPTAAGYAALQTVPLRSGQSAASRQLMLDALSFLPEVYPQIQSFDSVTNVTVNSVPIEVGTFVPVIAQKQDIWYTGFRLDHLLTQNDRIAYRVHIDHRNKPLDSGNVTFGERWAADSKYLAQNHSISYTKFISSTFINEARVSYARLDPSWVERDGVTPEIIISALKGNNEGLVGGSRNFPQKRLEQTYQFQNVSSYIRGNHSLKFGLDLARTRLNSDSSPGSKGVWRFADLQSYMNNSPNLSLIISPSGTYSFTELKQAYFFQDDIKLTRNLTVGLGLRYETSNVPLGYFGATTPDALAALAQGPGKRDKNNFAPRVGFAYSLPSGDGFLSRLFGNGETTLRGGYGIAYDSLFYSLLSSPAANYPRNGRTQITSVSALVDAYPVFTPPTPTLTSSTTFTNISSDAKLPTTEFWSLSAQRQFGSNYIVELGYSGSRSYHLWRHNQKNPGVLSAAKAAAVIAGCNATNLSTCQDPAGFPSSPSRLDPNWGSREVYETSGQSEYHAGYIRIERRFARGLRLGANYTWGATLSDTEDVAINDSGITGSSPLFPQDPGNRRNDWSRSILDRPHRFTVNYTYQIPGFTDAVPILRHALSGWQLSGFTEVQSGQPFTIVVGVDTLGTGVTSGRPDLNPGGILQMDPGTENMRTFNIPKDGTGIVTVPFVVGTSGSITLLRNTMPLGGTLGRNTFRGPGFSSSNVSLQKHFSLTEGTQLEVRGDFLNVFNHDNFQNPDANMNSVTFGRQTLVPITDARQVLLGAKLSF